MNARGAAVIEASFAITVMTAIASSTLAAGYGTFARTWLEYQSEQALYCLNERREPPTCRNLFRRSVATTLPFGRLSRIDLARTRDGGRIDCVWSWLGLDFRVSKALGLRRILSRAAS